MNFKRATEHHEIDFDLTAMIDVVFLLIIFFTFSTVFAKTVAKPLDLPREPGEPSPTVASLATTITVDIDKDGSMSLPGSGKVSADELVATVKSLVASARSKGANAELELVLRADRATPARHINTLAVTLARNGVRTWKLATSGESSPAAPPAGGAP